MLAKWTRGGIFKPPVMSEMQHLWLLMSMKWLQTVYTEQEKQQTLLFMHFKLQNTLSHINDFTPLFILTLCLHKWSNIRAYNMHARHNQT